MSSRPQPRGLAPEWRATKHHVLPACSSERTQVLFTSNIISVFLSLLSSGMFKDKKSTSSQLRETSTSFPSMYRFFFLSFYHFGIELTIFRESRVFSGCACIASVFAMFRASFQHLVICLRLSFSFNLHVYLLLPTGTLNVCTYTCVALLKREYLTRPTQCSFVRDDPP